MTDTRLTKLFGAAARVCEMPASSPGRAQAVEDLRRVVNSMSPLTAERVGAEPVGWISEVTKRAIRTVEFQDSCFALSGKQSTEFPIPLYAAPPASSDAIDAARWRPCTRREAFELLHKIKLPYDIHDWGKMEPEHIMRLIDAARSSGSPAIDAIDAAKYRALNTPEIHDFMVAVEREALHQRDRWGVEHDIGKQDTDWFWLVGYLAGKAINKPEKALHHIITTAAACLNWHAAKMGAHTAMQPGHAPSVALGAPRAVTPPSGAGGAG